jgi:hypothetical protein
MGVSMFVLVGACIAYHVLMKECAFTVFEAVIEWTGHEHIKKYWTPSTAALLVLILFPLTNMKEFSTLVLLNSFGIPFVLYTMFFIMYHGLDVLWTRAPLDHVDMGAKSSFGILGGIVTLSFFIHNAIQPIIRHSNPTHYTVRKSIIKI